MANEQAQADRPRAKDFPGFLFKGVPLPDHDSTILCEVSTGVNRPFVSEKLRLQVLLLVVYSNLARGLQFAKQPGPGLWIWH